MYDLYNDKKIIAGAPLNVASICSSLGMKSYIITACPQNKIKEVNNELKKRNIKGLISKTNIKIGEAKIKLINGIPNFEIDKKASFDFIGINNKGLSKNKNQEKYFYISLKKMDYLYFGTLCQRHIVSRNALKEILDKIKVKLIYDVNLRPGISNWKQIVKQNYKKAHIIKLNLEEYKLIKKNGIDLLKQAFKHKCEFLIITKGEKGSTLYIKKETVDRSNKKNKIIDTTGCGDAFLSGFIYGLKKNPKYAMKIATKCATVVARNKGAFSEKISQDISKLKIK